MTITDLRTATPSRLGVLERHRVTRSGRPGAPVLLFAHGFGSDQSAWQRVVPALTDDYDVVRFDNAGASSAHPDAYDADRHADLDGYAADLLDICEALDLHEVTVVGHSVSAMIAVRAAVADASRIARLVLLAPSPCYIDDPATGYVGGFTREDVDGLLESLEVNYAAWAAVMAPVVMGTPDAPELGAELESSFVRTDPALARAFARATFLSDSRHLLHRVAVPSLVLQCEADALAPTTAGDHLAEHLPAATLVRMRATGHCPHVSAPEETTALIRDYLRETS